MAATVYLMLLRRDTPRWLAAIAVAPVLLDAYQIQVEQSIMPDVWFEALIVAGIAILLYRVSAPGLRAVMPAGLGLGTAATIRQLHQFPIPPPLLFLLSHAPDCRPVT